MSENKGILLCVIVVFILGGILGAKILLDKPENIIISSQSNINNEKVDDGLIENVTNEQKAEIIQEGMDYAEEKARTEQDKLRAQKEKEEIQMVISLAMFGDNSVKGLTYNNIDEQLKIKFGEGKYKLSGPDSNESFIITIGTTNYYVDKNGNIN